MTEPTKPQATNAPRRLQYPGGIQPTIRSSTVTSRGVINEIEAGSRPSRIVMRQGSVVNEPDPEHPESAKKSGS